MFEDEKHILMHEGFDEVYEGVPYLHKSKLLTAKVV
jgi:hypothetical protein